MLHAPGFADPATGYRAWIDVPSFVDQIIINELSREMDAYVRSAYFYKDRGGQDLRRPAVGLRPDVRRRRLLRQPADLGLAVPADPAAGGQRLVPPAACSDPAFVNQVRARWQALRRGLLSDAALDARIAALTAPLGNAAQRNFQQWPNLTSAQVGFFNTPTAPTWQGQVQAMRDWMNRRVDLAGLDRRLGRADPADIRAFRCALSGWPDVWADRRRRPPGPVGGCTATYAVASQWTGGFQADVRVTAGAAGVRGWTVTWTFANGQTVSQAWGATVSAGGAAVTARNADYNGTLAAGASTSFGFIGTWNGANAVPTLTCAATA